MTRKQKLMAFALPLLLLAAVGGAVQLRDSWRTWRTGVYATTSTDELTIEAYRIAREIPEILAQIPCHCGCMKNRNHHSGNLDCFKTDHGENCPICVQTALHAHRLHKDGKSVEEI